MRCIGIYDAKSVCSVVMDKTLKNVIPLDTHCIVIHEAVMTLRAVASRDVGGVTGVTLDDRSTRLVLLVNESLTNVEC